MNFNFNWLLSTSTHTHDSTVNSLETIHIFNLNFTNSYYNKHTHSKFRQKLINLESATNTQTIAYYKVKVRANKAIRNAFKIHLNPKITLQAVTTTAQHTHTCAKITLLLSVD